MEKQNSRNIMLAFVSPVSERFLNNPIPYPDLSGRSYDGIQTNEAAIVYANREFSLDHVFLVASDKVKNEYIPEPNEYGHLTHLDFLKTRLCQEDNNFCDNISVVHYHDSTDMDETLRGVTDIAQTIMGYQKENKNDNITLYVDMTGGHRYSSMMMLAVMQLLQYEGIQIGHVLYTDFNKKNVFDATSLERVFQLVSGAAEFVNFGSVESLMDYFGGVETEQSPQLQELLVAMQEFSDAIKICRTGVIKDTLLKLKKAITAFRQEHGDGLEETLFASIIEVIEREYGNLIGDHSDDISIIRWCTKKGFLQQAMTLCTEWLPLYFIQHKVVYTDDESVKLDCEKQGEAQGKSWQVFLVTNYDGKETNNSEVFRQKIAEIRNDLVEILKGKRDINQSICKDYETICSFVKEYRNADKDLQLLHEGKLSASGFAQHRPLLTKISHAYYDVNKVNPDYKKTYNQFLQSFSKKSVLKRLPATGNDLMAELFSLKKEDEEVDNDTIDNSIVDPIELRWLNTVNRYKKLIRNGVFKSQYSEEDMINGLHAYFNLRMERNQVNHANAEAVKDANDTEDLINTSLNCIENIVNKHNA